MSGAITREQGETFAAFKARQQAAQQAEKAASMLRQKSLRWSREGRRERKYLEIITSNHDHSMDY